MPTYHKILVPYVESDLAERVLDTALGTALWSGADVVLLHVASASASLEPGEADADLNAIEAKVDAMLEAARARHASDFMPDRSRIKAEVRSGNVVDAIHHAVEELMIDLVVMGSHGRSGLLDAVTGSTTEQVLRKVPASVFVVHPQGFPYLRD